MTKVGENTELNQWDCDDCINIKRAILANPKINSLNK